VNKLIAKRIRQVVAGFFLCAIGAIMLSGCDQAPEGKEQQVDSPVGNTTVNASADTTAESVAKTVGDRTAAGDSAEASKRKEEAKKTKKPLNLQMPAGDDVVVGGVMELSEENKLPDLFVGHKEGTKVGGGILRDAENENYADSIEGAEVNVEFKID